jgi:hypothetical protein
VQTKVKHRRTKAVPIDLHECGHRGDEKITSQLVTGVTEHLLDQSMWGRLTGRPSKQVEAEGSVGSTRNECFLLQQPCV